MQITRNSLETTPGPSEWFTGSVFLDAVAAPAGGSRVSASSVHFTPGARNAWHTHPNGQTIWVTEGVGLCQRRGGPVEVIRPATASSSSLARSTGTGRRRGHLAIVEVDAEGNPRPGRARHRRGVRGGAGARLARLAREAGDSVARSRESCRRDPDQVRGPAGGQALQQTAAVGAFSPYFAAACATRPLQICFTLCTVRRLDRGTCVRVEHTFP